MYRQPWRVYAWLLAAAVGLAVGGSTLRAGELLVIANAEVQEQTLDKSTLKSLLLGNKQKWDDGTKVVLVLPRTGDDLDAFLKDTVGKTASQFDMFWKRQVFTGKGLMPRSTDNADQTVAQVRLARGALGLVPAGTKTDDVKVLKLTP